jgi:MoxR-like ATPase
VLVIWVGCTPIGRATADAIARLVVPAIRAGVLPAIQAEVECAVECFAVRRSGGRCITTGGVLAAPLEATQLGLAAFGAGLLIGEGLALATSFAERLYDGIGHSALTHFLEGCSADCSEMRRRVVPNTPQGHQNERTAGSDGDGPMGDMARLAGVRAHLTFARSGRGGIPCSCEAGRIDHRECGEGIHNVAKIQESSERLAANVERVIVGKHQEVRLALVALLCQGHLLIEDVPGTGKTMLARAMAKSLGCSFRRIQFTPDLLPSDVTGLSIYNQKTQEFEFRAGPVVSQIVLADEINRATPKTQSALLECMEERHMTVDGETRPMPAPFMVIATQNPIEYEGTFPLPEAQLDRFMLRLRMGYPDPIDEMLILDEQKRIHPVDSVEPVAPVEEVLEMQAAVREVYVDPAISDYIVRLVSATRSHPDVYLGASPRGSLALYRASQALAALGGRDFVIPDDIKALAEPALAHRLILKTAASIRGVDGRGIISEMLMSVPIQNPQPSPEVRHA